MQLSKKKIVGLGGLALVAGITAVAANVPAGAVSVGGAVDIVVSSDNDRLCALIEPDRAAAENCTVDRN